jgi:O-antigen/teichoic acid export membrane protein
MQLLIVSSIVGLLGESVAPVLKGSGNPAGIAALDAAQLVLVVVLGWPLVGTYGLPGAGIAWLSAIAVSQLLAARYLCRLFERPFAGLAFPLLAILSVAILATLVAALTESAIAGTAGLIAAVALSAVTVVAATFAIDRRLELGILETLAGPFPSLRRLARQSENQS